ncbi:hypothetical protein AWB80_07574 [Caballeronia pedi]|uniref:Uncharacterized protein n=1 Tax=Caballeronia pedi TaxID=1777141 RepID=A0A158DVU9_9BURK|nr:hypothetical protein [Caballeronia pedi]SAK98708.1 hypothetical protein AWB80_07574 [Caballeronia pedi]
MTTIFTGQAASIALAVQANGAPVALDPASTVSAQFSTLDGSSSIGAPIPVLSTDVGANWDVGIVVVQVSADLAGQLPVGAAMLTLTSSAPSLIKRFKIGVESAGTITKSALFVRDFIIDELRADNLMQAAATFFTNGTLSDDYLWGKLRAAEASVARDLRVPLVPTQFFPYDPTSDQIAALPAGMPYAVDAPYDYGPQFFEGDSWGYVAMRQKPVREIQSMRFAYPDPASMVFTVPQEWIRLDQKYGVVRLVPTTYSVQVPLSSFIMQAIAGGRTIPFMLEVTYIAGLENVARDYPDLIDVVKKLAVLKAIEDTFPAQSGSISADGLSESVSVSIEDYHATIDTILYGAKGTNGGLMTAIHGIRSAVLG